MGKEDTYVLRGKLVRKPRAGFSYGKTRQAITSLLLNFKADDVKKENLFERVGNVKIEDEKFDVPVKLNKHVYFGGVNNDIAREAKICEFIIKLEEHFGIGTGKSEEIDKRVRDMEAEGVIPVSHFTEFEEKDFES